MTSSITTIGYLGPCASFSETACRTLWPEVSKEKCVLFPSLDTLYNALLADQIHMAVMPVHNSVIGVLKQTNGLPYFDASHSHELDCVSQLEMPLNFCLLASAHTSCGNIQTLHVNPYAQTICAEWLKQYPQWKIVVHGSSSEAAKLAAHYAGHAALAGPSAATEYGLTLLQSNVGASTMRFASLVKKSL